MRTRPEPRYLRVVTSLVFLALGACVQCAHAQNQGSQVVRLPDPTPRELSPDLRFPNDSSVPPATQKLIAEQNQRRWQLILWATNELVVLSDRAEKAALAPPGAASKKELTVNATQIETLAKNLAIALKAH